MLDAIARVITRPNELFEELGENDRLASWAIWVVLLTTLVGSVAIYVSTLPQSAAFGPGSPFATFTLITTVVGGAIFSFLSWLVFGLLVRIGAGMEAKPWAVAGYATAPTLITSALLIILALLFPVEVTPIANLDDPQAIQQATEQLTREIQESTFGVGSQILNGVAMIWYFLLIYLGTRGTTGSAGRAVRSTVLVALVYGAFLIVPWLLAMP